MQRLIVIDVNTRFNWIQFCQREREKAKLFTLNNGFVRALQISLFRQLCVNQGKYCLRYVLKTR